MSLSHTAWTNLTAEIPRHAQIKQAKQWLRNRATQSTRKSQGGWRGDRHTYLISPSAAGCDGLSPAAVKRRACTGRG